MSEKQFDENKFFKLLRNPNTLDSETVILNYPGVIPKKENEF